MFIPTAADTDRSDKSWLIKNYIECERLGSVDIVDISAIDKKDWLPRLRAANVIVVGGGSGILYLMKWMVKSGLKQELPRLLKNRVYVGISSGSIIASKRLSAYTIFLRSSEPDKAPRGLGYVDFHIRPHLNNPVHSWVEYGYLKKVSKGVKGDLYALDDNSAILYLNGRIKVISEGRWEKYRGGA